MSNRKWGFGLLILFLLFAVLLLQFALSALHIRELVRPLEKSGASGDSRRHIVLIPQEQDNPFWRSVEQGAREAAGRYGMELDYTGPIRINPAEQLRLLEKAVAAKADGIVVQGTGDPEYRRQIDKAAEMGIPVITVDTDEPDSRRLAYVGTDNLAAGKEMGELVAKAAGGAGSIGVLIGSDQPNQRLRLQGFRSVIAQYPKLAIVDVRSSNISRLEAAQEAEEMMTLHPQIGYMAGFSALDGIGIMEAAGRIRPKELRIFAFDDLEETKEGIRQGRIVSTIVQQPRKMGYEAVALLSDYFAGQKPHPQHFTATSVLDRNSAGETASKETFR